MIKPWRRFARVNEIRNFRKTFTYLLKERKPLCARNPSLTVRNLLAAARRTVGLVPRSNHPADLELHTIDFMFNSRRDVGAHPADHAYILHAIEEPAHSIFAEDFVQVSSRIACPAWITSKSVIKI